MSARMMKLPALLPAMLFAAAAAAEGEGWHLSASRLVLETDRPSASVWFENRSDTPFMVTAAAASSDEAGRPAGRAEDVIVTPPAKLVGAHEKAAFKAVFIGDPREAGKGAEKLRYLRLHAVPGEKSGGRRGEGVSVSVSTTSWLKIFLRPARLRVRNAAEAAQLESVCRQGRAVLRNASPYWLTVRSVRDAGIERIAQDAPAPMVAPGGELAPEGAACGRPISVRAIDDFGLSVSVAVRSGESR